MSKSKVSTKKTAKKTSKKADKPAAKKAKTPFYAQPARLFTAAKNGGLPRGVYAKTDLLSLNDVDVKVGNDTACVFEGKLIDLLAAALKAQGIKLNNDGAEIPSPASASATPSA